MSDVQNEPVIPATAEPNFLEMSDEDIQNFDFGSLDEVSEATDPVIDEEEEDDNAKPNGESTDPVVADDAADDDPDLVPDGADAESDDTNTGGDDKEKEPAQEIDAAQVADDFFKKVTAPFNANGKEMRVEDPDDAVRLMKMGANYNKKMVALKPNLKYLKLLEHNGLLDEGKLSFLIDLSKKDPAAISKLIKDSGIDPMDLDTENLEYKPNTYTVDDRELDLDGIIEDIRDTPTYAKTIDVVSNKWDAKSKQVVANAPQLLEVINTHVASGVYDLISSEVDRQRMFGELKGLSDIEAYRQVGDAIQAKGGFDHLAAPKSPAPKTVIATKNKPVDPKLAERRKAAGSPKTSAAQMKTPSDFNPLGMSDEEFAKQMDSKFL